MPGSLFVPPASRPTQPSTALSSAIIAASSNTTSVQPSTRYRKRARQVRFGQRYRPTTSLPIVARRVGDSAKLYSEPSFANFPDEWNRRVGMTDIVPTDLSTEVLPQIRNTLGVSSYPTVMHSDTSRTSQPSHASSSRTIPSTSRSGQPVQKERETMTSDEDDDDWVVKDAQDQTLFLVDAFGLLYRSYYALVKTTMSSRGMFDTRAIYGFTMVMLSFLQKYAKGNPVAVVFEGKRLKGQTDFRTALYPEYKESRGPTPTGVVEAIPWVKRLCRIMGLAVIEVDIFEADDTIGSLVRKARRAGVRSVIVSVDKDFRQLLDGDRVKILRPGSGGSFEYVTEETFRKEFADLHPRQYVDVLTLIGDKADGLKGVPGIGTLTAPRLIAQYGKLENLLMVVRKYFEKASAVDSNSSEGGTKASGSKKSSIEGLPLLTKRIAASLRDNEQHALLVKKLITIQENVPLVDVKWVTLQRKPVNEQEAKDTLRVLEFTNRNVLRKVLQSADDVDLLRGIPNERRVMSGSNSRQGQERSIANPVGSEEAVLSDEVSGPMSDSNENTWDAGDIEYLISPTDSEIDREMNQATGTIAMMPVVSSSGTASDILVGIAISTIPGRAVFINCAARKALPKSVSNVLQDIRLEKTGWFLKSLYKQVLLGCRITLAGKLFDNRIASELLHAGERITDARLASLYLGRGALDPWISGRDHRISPSYTREDSLPLCDMALRLSLKLKEEVEKAGVMYVLDSIELPLIPVLGDMEMVGVPINSDGLRAFEARVRSRLEGIEASLRDLVPTSDDSGKTFRPSSRDDVASLIFDTWKINLKVKKTSSGKFPVNKRVLSLLAGDERCGDKQRTFAKLMLEYREAAKILNTYTKSLLAAVHRDGRIRATFVQEAAATGRLSTSNPNLQSIPIRSILGREVRSMVRASDGFSILCADYSQIELRIIASLSGDESLKSAFVKGTDVHKSVAAKIFRLDSPSDVTDEQRRKAKEVNYGIPYGISAYGLGQQLGISGRDAKSLMSQFHDSFPRVKQLTERLIAEARDSGYARTMLGRRLPLPLLLHGGPEERKAAGRVAVNMPIQGSQADMIKLAMIRIADRLRTAKARSRLIMQLHDELVLEVENSELEAVKSLVEEEMISAVPLSGVDIVVNTGTGESWLCAAHS